jgi:hypothetical protein
MAVPLPLSVAKGLLLAMQTSRMHTIVFIMRQDPQEPLTKRLLSLEDLLISTVLNGAQPYLKVL